MQFLKRAAVFGVFLTPIIAHTQNISQTPQYNCALESPTPQQSTQCIDPAEWQGKTIHIPENTLQLNGNALTFCPLEIALQGQQPAVLFIVDQSNSMDPNCTDCYPENGWLPGDPYEKRIQMVHQAIEYLYSEGQGYAGFIGFAKTLDDPTIQMTLLNQDSINAWKAPGSPIQLDYRTGTNYELALDEAKTIIANFRAQDPPTDNISIVMISDGKPNAGTSNLNTLLTGLDVPIHGIFLGAEGNDGDLLENLALDTEGSYSQIDPQDSTALETVLDNLMENLTQNREAAEVEISINGNSYTSQLSELDSGKTQSQFSQSLVLQEDSNSIAITVRYIDPEGVAVRKVESQFALILDADAHQDTLWQGDDYFSARCALRNQLELGDYLNPSLFFDEEKGFLNKDSSATFVFTQSHSIKAQIFAPYATGDTLELEFKSLNTSYTKTEFLIRQSGANFSGTFSYTGAKFDSLLVEWTNPQNPRDGLNGKILIYEDPKISFSSDTLWADSIGVLLIDPSQTQIPLEIILSNDLADTLDLLSLTKQSALEYAGLASLQWSDSLSPNNLIIASYMDSLFGEIHRDTSLLFGITPQLPKASLFDTDGDGSVDLLRWDSTLYKAEQSFSKIRLIWGAEGQDTLFLNPEVALQKEVEIKLPFGHTSGPDSLGAGQIEFTGVVEGYPFVRTVAATDRVGPILLRAWVSPENDTALFVKLSEPLAEPATDQQLYWLPSQELDSLVLNTKTYQLIDSNTYSFTLDKELRWQLNLGDSIKLVEEVVGGLRDKNFNGAHPQNPYQLLLGAQHPVEELNFGPTQSVSEEFSGNLKEIELFNTDKILVMAKDPTNNRLTNSSDNPEPSEELKNASLSFELSFKLPQQTGLNANGEWLEGSLKEGELIWESEFFIAIWVYDALGQFIGLKNGYYFLDDPSLVNDEGEVNLEFFWLPYKDGRITDTKGRAVGTGPLLVQITLVTLSAATQSVEIFEADGSLSEQSVQKGEVQRIQQQKGFNLGYKRK